MTSGEVKTQEGPGPSLSVSPWDVIVWKLDSLEKRLDRQDASIAELRREVRADITDLREELRSFRLSFGALLGTMVLGFAAMLVSMWLMR